MAAVTTAAILLRAHPFSESSRVLRFYTRALGLVGVMARGVRRGASRGHGGGGAFSEGVAVLAVRDNRELQTLQEFAPAKTRFGLARDVSRLAGASLAAELVLRHAGQEPHEELYSALSGGLDRLEGVPPEAVLAELLALGWAIVQLLGFGPELEACVACGQPLEAGAMGWFDLQAGGVRVPAADLPREPGGSAPWHGGSSGNSSRERPRTDCADSAPTCRCSTTSPPITCWGDGGSALSAFWNPSPRVGRMPLPKTNLILGTAGHIDHGKTALVRALTGVDTDRLAEEKERGITIELGFARFTPAEGCAFGIVDVPGHEGFVRTMVAGATGMDVVLLVVAGDEGVMPQTREHMAIVTMLGVGAMVVAITKTDLVDEEWLELVREDVRDLLEGTPYEDAEVVPTSVHDPSSLESLSRALVRSGKQARERTADDLFRLPVDRVFAVEGTGTVVTGTLWSGSVARGEAVRILPGGGDARVRAVQVHGAQVDHAVAGQRTALALTGVAVRRGLIARGTCWSPTPTGVPR